MTQRPALDVISHSPDQTRRIGMHIGRLAIAGDVFLLSGQVGGGKTTFVQGLARGLGVAGYVQSPTFALAAEHAGLTSDGSPVRLYHLDFYRLEGAGDLASFGYEEYFDDPSGIVVAEWPERVTLDLPVGSMVIGFEHLAQSKRRLLFYPRGPRFDQLVATLRSEAFGAQRRSSSPSDR